MNTQAPDLGGLLGALRYACQRDFAQLGNVRDLGSLLDAALVSGGLPAPLRGGLVAERAYVDHPRPEVRKAALRRLLARFDQAGVALPGELKALATSHASPSTGRLRVPLTEIAEESARLTHPRVGLEYASGHGEAEATLPAVGEPAGRLSARLAPAEVGSGQPRAAAGRRQGRPAPPQSGGTREATTGGGGSGRRKPAGVRRTEAAAARLLSIAPRRGPLATALKDVGWKVNPRLLSELYRRGVRKVGDVLFLLPRCYEDRRRISTIAELVPGERGVTVAVVRSAGEVTVARGRRFFRAVLADATGSIAATFFRSGPWLKSRFPVGKRLLISGEVRAYASGRDMAHPEIEPAEDLESSSTHFGRIVPIYPGFERHEQRAFRDLAYRIAQQHARHLEDPLPEPLRAELGLCGLAEAIAQLHFPEAESDLQALDSHQSPAHRRLAFDELFFLQLGVGLKRQGVKVQPGIAFRVDDQRMTRAKALLPFTLTGAQARVVKELAGDMGRPEPMNRLIQGDVGSGKTAVAAVAAALALQDGYQVALMAPTEILAEQHHRTLTRLLEPAGYRVGLVTAGVGAKRRREVKEALASGEVQVAVGTHALIQGDVTFARLGLAIVDEQHRFGVIQRHALMDKGVRPDVLVMTATPIPRTLAMTLYGDLDVSIIDELPPGRTPIVTRVFGERARAKVYSAIAAELEKGHQAYVVYPLVEESEKVDLADATRGAETLRQRFPGRGVGLLHGRMGPDEKDAVMQDFRDRRVELLVCTTVVEVGVDVPNASVMVVESAERFGLSQLHQLRGRVGRGAAASYCFLVAGSARSKESADRLAVMERSSDGFVIAEKDLELRGPGEFLGTRQSGIPELAVANLARDADLLSLAQARARAILEKDPRLTHPAHAALVRALEERWEGRLALANVG